MRIAATAATLFALAACTTTDTSSPYQQPNELMGTEISQRIDQIPFQHREELIQNLLWLVQAGEQTIPALIEGLCHENAKVRSNCCWVLGQLRDRRTVPDLQSLITDPAPSVQLEAARSLVLMGDIAQAPKLIEALDSDRKEVRYLCHEALKTATGHDFGYDHLGTDQRDLQLSVLRWRQWWGEYSGDRLFAQSYEQTYGLGNLAAPAGETQPLEDDAAPTEATEGEIQDSEATPSESGSPEPTEGASGATSEEPTADGQAAGTAKELQDPTEAPAPSTPSKGAAGAASSAATSTSSEPESALAPPKPTTKASESKPASTSGATSTFGPAASPTPIVELPVIAPTQVLPQPQPQGTSARRASETTGSGSGSRD